MTSVDQQRVSIHNVKIPVGPLNEDLASYGLNVFLQNKVLDYVYRLIRNKFDGVARISVHDYGEPRNTSDIFHIMDLGFCTATIHEMPAWDPLGVFGKFLPGYAPRSRINIRIVKK